MFEKHVFFPGEIIFNGFDKDIFSNFDPDSDLLSEHMLQVKYPRNLAIDIGWHAGMMRFMIHIVQDSEWMNPIEKRLCKDVESLLVSLNECIENVKMLIEKEF